MAGHDAAHQRTLKQRALEEPKLHRIITLYLWLVSACSPSIGGWVHKQGPWRGLHEIAAIGVIELTARTLMLVVAFIPFFAFWELGRVLSMPKPATLFFSKPRE